MFEAFLTTLCFLLLFCFFRCVSCFSPLSHATSAGPAFYLRSLATDHVLQSCLTGGDGNNVGAGTTVVSACRSPSTLVNQQWVSTPTDGGWCTITAVHGGLALELLNAQLGNGGKVGVNIKLGQFSLQSESTHRPQNQQWKIVQRDNGYVSIINRANPETANACVLDVTAQSRVDGAPMQMWGWGGNTNQQWAIQNITP